MTITAETVAQAIICGWIACFDVPSTVTTDCRQQFALALWQQLMQLLGTKHICTTSYHPIANGLVEHFHRQLKAALKSSTHPTNWTDSLPMVLLSIRTAWKDDIHCSMAELVYGTTLRLPGEFFDHTKDDATSEPASYVTHLRSSMQQLQGTPLHQQSPRKVHVSDHLSTCTQDTTAAAI